MQQPLMKFLLTVLLIVTGVINHANCQSAMDSALARYGSD